MNATKNTSVLILTAISATLIAAQGCSNGNGSPLKSLENDTFMVKVGSATYQTIENNIILPGSVKAWQEAIIYPRAAGKLKENILSEGDVVKKDQNIAFVERDEVGVVHKPMVVPSTIDGEIGRIYQDVGANVTTQTPIALVVDQQKVRVQINVPERYVGLLYKGQTAQIQIAAYPNKKFRGTIYKISPVVDPDTRATLAEILVDNKNGQLKTGMFGEVALALNKKTDAIVIPSDAMITENGNYFVFKPGKDGRAVMIPIKTGITTENYVEITSGAKAGEEIITFGLYGLKNGSKIKITD
ncbi:MAG: efflux RND transporter periplasmic adaptor subunit [Elusimicrobiaceae bacterium]